jgi:aminomethyltransferase
MSDLLRTPLYPVHVTAKARLVPFAGWEMPVQYTGVLPEVKAVRENIGLFDVSHMGRVRVHGPDALAYLQHLVVSDVARLSEAGGEAQYSLLCLEAGGIIDDIIIYRLSAQDFIIVLNASNRAKDIRWLQLHSHSYNVHIDDESEITSLIAVQGPKAMDLLDSLSDRALSVIPRFGLDESVIAGIRAMVARTGYTGEDGMELFCKATDAVVLWNALMDAGATPCGLGARDTLRLEAALPLYGHEMDEHTHPYEARLGWVVKTEKAGNFLGKNALTELKKSPRLKALVGIEIEGRGIPRDGYTVTADGDTIGYVTSGTFSPMRGKGIAMARIATSYSKVGTAVEVIIRETPHTARVVALPFYKNV